MNHALMTAAIAYAFDESIRRTIVEILDEAYQAAGIRYDQTTGCNCLTFGTELYHFAKFRFQGRGDPGAAPIILGETSSEYELRLTIGSFNVACHRVGSSATDDIAKCFPSSSGGPSRLARLNTIQLELDLGRSGGDSIPRNIVIAHLGNPHNGLEAVYLAVPQSVSESGRINSWDYTELMWQWDGEQTGDYTIADLPPAVPIDEATVELREAFFEAEDASS